MHAQLAGQSQSDINVNMIPENPGPNQIVDVSLTSYTTDINAANITWKINGKTLKTGEGEKAFNFTTGGMNTTTVFEVLVLTIEGKTIDQTFNIKPTLVDLMWQSDSFTPPFYKGKAMFSHENKITFIALPHITDGSGQEISAKNLIYTWTQNGSVMDSDSGYGKNTYTQVASLISRPIDVSVRVTSTDTDGVGSAEIVATPANPFIIFYENNPLYGIEFQKALQNNVDMKDSQEITVLGVPFFFGTLTPTPPELSYKWSVNGVPINNDPSANMEVFRGKEGTSGTSNISLSIENSQKILQYTSNNFNLSFGNTTN